MNFEDPVTPFIDDFYWDIVPTLKKKSDIFISKAEARLQDDLFQYNKWVSIYYYQVDDFKDYIAYLDPKSPEIIAAYLRLSKRYSQIDRRVQSFLDMLGTLGGVYNAVFSVSGILILLVSEWIFLSNMISKLYFV